MGLKNQTVYVVTDAELGWDCVIGVFSDPDDADRVAATRSLGNVDAQEIDYNIDILDEEEE